MVLYQSNSMIFCFAQQQESATHHTGSMFRHRGHWPLPPCVHESAPRAMQDGPKMAPTHHHSPHATHPWHVTTNRVELSSVKCNSTKVLNRKNSPHQADLAPCGTRKSCSTCPRGPQDGPHAPSLTTCHWSFDRVPSVDVGTQSFWWTHLIG